ncbi:MULTISPECIES: DUF1304 domain-containing protein [Nocardiaceae]|uniref:DUF1304 domain-containing protein n=1 Tax=Nocardiaceae TaxID=85025 RepID=UPI001BAF1D42|nr:MULTISPECIES: DUF1304 domain-containing protein [Rhodococcus]
MDTVSSTQRSGKAMVIVTGFVLGGLAALMHVFIFYLESIAWESESARSLFRTGTVDDARATKFVAFNQGFYNLFLAILVVLGIAIAAAGDKGTGATLTLAGTGIMLCAALVLFISSRAHRSAATKQGIVPFLSVIALTVGLVL